jgi:hypothetical protein
MVVLHLRKVAVASLNRRRRPLKRLGMLRRPRFPTRQQLRCQLPGARMPLTCLFHRLEHERDLGFVHRMARAATLFVPVHQRKQHVFSPLRPPRRHRQLRQVLTYRLPPEVHQGRHAGKLLLDLGQGVFVRQQPVGLEQRFDRLELGSQLLLYLLRCLAERVRKPPGMQDARHIGQVLPPSTSHLLPVLDRGGTGCYPGLGLATWPGSAWAFFCTFARPCLACSRARLAWRRRPKMQSEYPLARS